MCVLLVERARRVKALRSRNVSRETARAPEVLSLAELCSRRTAQENRVFRQKSCPFEQLNRSTLGSRVGRMVPDQFRGGTMRAYKQIKHALGLGSGNSRRL
jgi:hypothetical protein